MAYFSIMLPVYNGEDLVSRAIESVLRQPFKDIELLILNDGSTDSTFAICNEYQKVDSRVKVITHKNVGLGKNRNDGFNYLTGKWTIFLDHDDLILDNSITQELVDFLEDAVKYEFDLIVPARVVTDYSNTMASIENVPYEGVYNGGNEKCWCIDHEFATLIYRTDLLMDNNIRFEETRPEMESIFRHKAVYLSRKVLFTNHYYFAVRRRNPTSISSTWNYGRILPVRIQGYKKLMQWHYKLHHADVAVCRASEFILIKTIKLYIKHMVLAGTPVKEVVRTLNDIDIFNFVKTEMHYANAKTQVLFYILNIPVLNNTLSVLLKFYLNRENGILDENTEKDEYSTSYENLVEKTVVDYSSIRSLLYIK